jgi:hypothetical protein
MISEYETDFYAWTQEQAQALRARQGEALDWNNLAEEIESMGRSDADALASQLTRLLMHLLMALPAESAFAQLEVVDDGGSPAHQPALAQIARPESPAWRIAR